MLYPKIGIRPTIDGRWGGIREGLEDQTMAMARNAKKLIEKISAIPMEHRFSAFWPTPPSEEARRLLHVRISFLRKM